MKINGFENHRNYVAHNILTLKIIQKAYKFELKPTAEQKVLLNKTLGCVRFVYNYFLNERIQQYRENKRSDNYYAQAKALVDLKREKPTLWLKDVNSQALQFSLRSLESAFQGFFSGKTGYPKFKSRKNNNSFTAPQHIKLVDDKVYLPKFKEGITVNVHREVKGEVRKMTFSRTPSGKYFVSILTEQQYQPKEKKGTKVGVDLGLKHLFVTSDEVKFENNQYTKKYEKKLARAQKHLSRKTKGSRGSEKQRIKVARLHEKISNTRKDTLHKASHRLVSDYDLIAIEDLNVKGMMSNSKLSKHIADASWGTFVKFLEYKAEWDDKQVVKVDRFFPSSKTCHVCGWINQDLDLSMREWTCQSGHHLDRDINAAKNILQEALQIISAGTVDYTGGDDVRLSNQQLSVKPEAQLIGSAVGG